MKKIFIQMIFICFLSIGQEFSCQDIDYNFLYDNGKEGEFYAKRESNNEVWVKFVQPEKKIKLKNGKTTTVKGEELKELYGCNCSDNLIKNITHDGNYRRVDNETLEQLILDFSCSDLVYNKLIGNSEDGFNFYLGKVQDNGNYKIAWIKSMTNEDRFIPEEGQEMTFFDPETGKVKQMKMENVVFETGYHINKYMIDCNNHKIGTIVLFSYNSKNNMLSENFHPQYFTDLGLKDIEYESEKIIYNEVCLKQ